MIPNFFSEKRNIAYLMFGRNQGEPIEEHYYTPYPGVSDKKTHGFMEMMKFVFTWKSKTDYILNINQCSKRIKSKREGITYPLFLIETAKKFRGFLSKRRKRKNHPPLVLHFK